MLFASGALINIVALALPGGEEPDLVADIIPAAIAVVCAGVLWRYGRRAPTWLFHAVVQVGNLVIGLSIVLAGPVEVHLYPLFYMWGIIYAFHFFSLRASLLHYLVAATEYAVLLLIRGSDASWISMWFVKMGSFLVVGLLVYHLTERIRALAHNDTVTGLKNRRTFEVELEDEMNRRNGDPLLWVILMDLDGFKEVNDSLGHQAGDRFLKEAAAAWSETIRSGDLLARYGGDEFAVILRDCSREHGEAVTERLRSAVPNGHTCSIGMAHWNGLETSAELLRRVDKALYEAKAAGRDRVSIAA